MSRGLKRDPLLRQVELQGLSRAEVTLLAEVAHHPALSSEHQAAALQALLGLALGGDDAAAAVVPVAAALVRMMMMMRREGDASRGCRRTRKVHHRALTPGGC